MSIACASCRPVDPVRSEPSAPIDSLPAEAYRAPVAALMWPGATRSHQVTAAGDLFNGDWYVHLDPASGGAAAGPPAAIAYEDRWLPIARWSRTSGDLRWEFEAVALPEPAPGLLAPRGGLERRLAGIAREQERRLVEASLAGYAPGRSRSLLRTVRRTFERDPAERVNLYVSLAVTAINASGTSQPARLDVRFAQRGPSPPFADRDSLERDPSRDPWGEAAASDAALGLWSDATHAGPGVAWTIPPGGRRSTRLVLPVYATPRGDLERWARAPHARRIEQARSFWNAEVGRGARFDLPDPEIRRALRAARVVLLALRERRAGDWVPIGGPFHYRDVWLRDGARAVHALAISGYTEEARATAASFLHFQWPHGAFISQTGQLDGTGQALWALEQTLLRPAPARNVARFADAALEGWRSLESSRASAGSIRGALPGLLPVTDPHDNELVAGQLVGNDAWAIAGGRAVERLLRAAGRTADADRVGAELGDYVETFRRALAAHDDVPPSWRGDGIDWGNLSVAWPCRALDPGDDRLTRLARRYWAGSGGAGLGYYRNPDSLHGYAGADLATWALLAGRPQAADSVLDAMLAWRSATGGIGELFTRSTRDFGRNFPPHPTSAAALIAIVRNALVYDDDDTLRLTLGARAAWWRGAAVRRAPTRWGLIDLELERREDVASWRWTPVPVWTALTLPPGTRLAQPLPEGLRAGAREDVVLAPPRAGSVRLKVREVPFAAVAGRDSP